MTLEVARTNDAKDGYHDGISPIDPNCTLQSIMHYIEHNSKTNDKKCVLIQTEDKKGVKKS